MLGVVFTENQGGTVP